MIVRRSAERGYANHGWLRSFHTFSFADYYDPKQMGFRALRVINEDRVQPGKGFPAHGHKNMEIISYVLEGEIEHRDSLGTGSIIHPGEVQRMTAGTGVTHSEFNPSPDKLLHFLQIWILPGEQNLKPGYEQKAFPEAERRGTLRLVASPDGRQGSLTVHQDVSLYAGLFASGEKALHEVARNRYAWIQVAKGNLDVNGTRLEGGDGAAVSEPGALEIVGQDAAEVLVFDLG
jgi:redox-sensitive bicupin YhaK (pirin superfamily)